MNYKHKNRLLVIGFIVMLVVAYKLAIQKTVESKSMLLSMTNEKELLRNASNSMSLLKQQDIYLDSLLKSYDISSNSSFQQVLLQKITRFSKENKLQIIAFNEPHTFVSNGTKLSTYAVEVKGYFIPLLQLVQFLEQQQLGELVSIHFEKKKNYRINRNFLTCKLLLQKVGN
ncbi:MAG: hypothetical protein JKY69_01295 [Flavobacteriaceae bacterium]|nr:hypothetical protein [Flavobacteriaceae bacterium]